MINKKMYDLGVKPSDIRTLFEYGKIRKKEIGEENVKIERNDSLQRTLDDINKKYGNGSIVNASELKNKD